MTKSLSTIWNLSLVIITIAILYKNKQITLNGITYLINYAKANLKKINHPAPAEQDDFIDFGNGSLNKLLPFDIVEAPPPKKVKIKILTWGVWAITEGSNLIKEPLAKSIKSFSLKISEKSDPNDPLWNPYNDNKLIKSILDELDELNK